MYGTAMYGGASSRYGVADILQALRADVTGSTLLSATPYIRSLTGGFLSALSLPSRTAADRPEYASKRLAVPAGGAYLDLRRIHQNTGRATIANGLTVVARATMGVTGVLLSGSVAGVEASARRAAVLRSGISVPIALSVIGHGGKVILGNQLVAPIQSGLLASGDVSTGPEAFLVYDAGTDPRTFPTFSFTGDANRTQRDSNNIPQPVAANVPRYQYYLNGQPYFLVEAHSATNFLLNSATPATQTVSLNAGTYTLWMEGTGSVAANGATDGAYGTATGLSVGQWLTFTVSATQSVTFTVTGTVVRFQCENTKFPTSFIITTSAAVTRAGEVAKFVGTGLDVSAGAALYASYIERGTALSTFAYLMCIGGDGMALNQGGGAAGTMTIEVPFPAPHVQSSIFSTASVAYGDTVEMLGWTRADGTTNGVGTINGVQKPTGLLSGTHAVSTDGNIYLCATSSAGNPGWAAFKRIIVDNHADKTLADMRIAHMPGVGQVQEAQAILSGSAGNVLTGSLLRAARATIPIGVQISAAPAAASVVTTVIVSPSSVAINVGDTFDPVAQAMDQNGQPMSATFVWSSSDATIATVDSTGLVTGVAAGSATITATANGKSASCVVTVATPAPQALFVYTAGVDPRSLPGVTVTFTGDANRTQRDSDGIPQPVAANVPRFNYYIDGVPHLMIEGASRTNFLLNSTAPATQTVSLGAGTYTLWVEGAGSCAASGATDGAYGTATGPDVGQWLTFTVSATQDVTFTVTGSLDRFQCENSKFATSFIITTTAAVTRAGEKLTIDGIGLNLPQGASLYVAYVDQGSSQTAFSRSVFYGVAGSTDILHLSDGGSANGTITVNHAAPGVTELALDFAHASHYGDLVEVIGRIFSDGSVQGVGWRNGVAQFTSAQSAAKAFGAPPTRMQVGGNDGGSGGFLAIRKIVADQGTTKTVPDMQTAVRGAPAVYDFSGTVYIAPSGSPTGTGTIDDPIDLTTASKKAMAPGTAIWLLGGIYAGQYDTYFTGTEAEPIVVRNYQRQRVTIDGYLKPHGADTYYWGLEVMYSEPTRQTDVVGSAPAGLPRVGHTFAGAPDAGPRNHYINCIIHDLADGTGDDNPIGTEIGGCLVYNNGWLGPDRGHGHGIYTQNNTPSVNKLLYDNIVFNNFSTGITIHGNGDNLRGFDLQGGAIFTSGGPSQSVFGYQRNLEIEGSTEMGDITVDRLSSYHFAAVSGSIHASNLNEPTNYPLSVTNSIFQGTADFNGWQGLTLTGNKVTTGPIPLDAQSRELRVQVKPGLTYADYTIDNNQYAFVPAPQFNLNVIDASGVSWSTSDLAQWQAHTGWDLNSTYQATVFTGADILVQPNRYESGRGHIICWNWDGAETLDIDLSTVLNVGDPYEIRHVYDLFGTATLVGVYDGTPVTLSQVGYTPTQPIGWDTPLATTAPNFNVFVIQALTGQISPSVRIAAVSRVAASGSAGVFDAQVASVTVSPSSAVMDAGNTTQLTAQAFNAAGEVIPNAVFSWTSTSPSVASVDATGLVTAVMAGSVNILVTSGTADATCAVTVNAVSYATATFGTSTFQGDVGSTDNGLPLVQYNGTQGQVTGGQLLVSSDDRALAVVDVGQTDLTVEADLLDATKEQGVCARVVDGNNYYAARWGLGSTILAIEKRVAGVLSTLASLDVGTHTGRVGLTVHGSRLIVTLNGVIQYVANDTDLATGTQAGAYGHGALVDNMDWTSPKYDRAPLSGNVYVSPTGTNTATGTFDDPLTLLAVTQASIEPGTTVEVLGGTYVGDFTPGMSGISGSPIVFRAYQRQRVTIDGSCILVGDYLIWRDMEVMSSDTLRTTTTAGSHPLDLPRSSRECRAAGAYSKFINMVVHDLANGIVSQNGGQGFEANGCIIYNNGWDGPDRAHGHSLYIQNALANVAKSLIDCVGYCSFDEGVSMFGTSDADLAHLVWRGTAIFGSGTASSVYGVQRDINVSNSAAITDHIYDTVSVHRVGSGTTAAIKINDAGASPASNITMTGCIIRGGLQLEECNGYSISGLKLSSGADVMGGSDRLLSLRLRPGGVYTENSIDSNSFATPAGGLSNFFGAFEDDNPAPGVSNDTLAQWQARTGYDLNSTFLFGQYSTADIIIRPSQYEVGRGLVICHNWPGAATLDADLSNVLAVGDVYSVWHVYDVFGPPVIDSVTYDGNPVTLPQTGYVPPTPIGYSSTPPSASPDFNIFLVRLVDRPANATMSGSSSVMAIAA